MKFEVKRYEGKTFGALTVIGKDESNDHFNANHWLFRCICGNEFSDYPSRIISGHKKSCGCQKSKSSYKHGCNGNEFYPTWWAMMRRCYHEENHNYERYGGRGITVCEEWHDAAVFISWARSTIGHKRIGMTLDRKDNNKGYYPENCHWVSSAQQANNRRSNRYETLNGETKTFSEWCKIYMINPETVRQRQKRGMSFFEAVSQPVTNTKFRKQAASII